MRLVQGSEGREWIEGTGADGVGTIRVSCYAFGLVNTVVVSRYPGGVEQAAMDVASGSPEDPEGLELWFKSVWQAGEALTDNLMEDADRLEVVDMFLNVPSGHGVLDHGVAIVMASPVNGGESVTFMMRLPDDPGVDHDAVLSALLA